MSVAQWKDGQIAEEHIHRKRIKGGQKIMSD